MRKDYVGTKAGQVHFVSAGCGETVLLLHQTPYSSDEYSEIIPTLAKFVRVIAMDTLGYGNSDKPPKGFSIEDYTRVIVEFLDRLNIQETSIVGHHTGATLASELAAAYPKRVNKVILSGLAVHSLKEQETIRQRYFLPMEIDKEGKFLLRLWEGRRTIAPYLSADIIYRRLLADLEAGPRFHDAHEAELRYDKLARLSLIRSPVLLMYGTGDMFFSKLEQIKKLINNPKVQIVETKGNGIMYEKPYEVAQIILKFLGQMS